MQPIVKPKLSDKVDYECELAVIIGKGGRYISEAAAYDHVAGYSCYNDVSIRDYQNHTSQWTPGKNFPASGPFGPYFVTPDEVGELKGKHIRTRLNGKRSHATFDRSFSGAAAEEYIRASPRFAGRCDHHGNPGGVGFRRDPPVWMAGDTVEIEIDGVGLQKHNRRRNLIAI